MNGDVWITQCTHGGYSFPDMLWPRHGVKKLAVIPVSRKFYKHHQFSSGTFFGGVIWSPTWRNPSRIPPGEAFRSWWRHTHLGHLRRPLPQRLPKDTKILCVFVVKPTLRLPWEWILPKSRRQGQWGSFHMSSRKVRKSNNGKPIGSMYAIYGDIYHQYTPNVSIYTIHGSYGKTMASYIFP